MGFCPFRTKLRAVIPGFSFSGRNGALYTKPTIQRGAAKGEEACLPSVGGGGSVERFGCSSAF